MMFINSNSNRSALRRVGLVAAAVLLLLSPVGCSSSDSEGPGEAGQTVESTSSTVKPVDRPAGPVAALKLLDKPGEPFIGESVPNIPDDFDQVEFLASGQAIDYTFEGTLPTTGEWKLAQGSGAKYATRVLVRRPSDPGAFSGTVVMEWLNVSGGVDANPEFTSLADEIARKGHIWVGVSAQQIGVSGGPVLVKAPGTDEFSGKGLKSINAARYGDLVHPGDGFAYDIFTQVARAVREGGAATADVEPQIILAAGESQSAIALTSYYNGVQPLTKAFDGFFIHSRAFAALPFVAPGKAADLVGAMGANPTGVLLRTDLDAPVLDLQAEGDVLGILNSYDARQPDTDRFRLWEVAGASHADTYLLGPIADQLDCGAPINSAPFHVVAKAGLRALDDWVRTGTAPPFGDRLEVTGMDDPKFVRDDLGIVKAGVRLPVTDVPVDVLSGDPPPSPDLICQLMGSTTPLSAAQLSKLYKDGNEYESKFEAATDSAVAAGFVLAEDREALLAYAEPGRVK